MGIQSAQKLETHSYLLNINLIQTIMSSQTVCCGCNVFTLAKIITGIEIGLSLISFIATEASHYPNYEDTDVHLTVFGICVIYWAYLATEYIGIHKKMRCLIIFNCVIRVILIVLLGLASISYFGYLVWLLGFYVFVYAQLYIVIVTVMAYMIYRTLLQFKIFKAVKEGPGNAFTMSEQPYVYTTLNTAKLMEFQNNPENPIIKINKDFPPAYNDIV